jgi:hypothetical protein
MRKEIIIKIRTGIDTTLIELLPAATICTDQKTLSITWLVFFIEFSAKCAR